MSNPLPKHLPVDVNIKIRCFDPDVANCNTFLCNLVASLNAVCAKKPYRGLYQFDSGAFVGSYSNCNAPPEEQDTVEIDA